MSCRVLLFFACLVPSVCHCQLICNFWHNDFKLSNRKWADILYSVSHLLFVRFALKCSHSVVRSLTALLRLFVRIEIHRGNHHRIRLAVVVIISKHPTHSSACCLSSYLVYCDNINIYILQLLSSQSFPTQDIHHHGYMYVYQIYVSTYRFVFSCILSILFAASAACHVCWLVCIWYFLVYCFMFQPLLLYFPPVLQFSPWILHLVNMVSILHVVH